MDIGTGFWRNKNTKFIKTYKEQEFVANNDYLCPEWTWHIKKTQKYIKYSLKQTIYNFCLFA